MNRFLSRSLVGGGIGVGVGVLVALPLFFAVQLSGGLYEFVNAPALWLAHSLADAGLTPRGEFAAWVAVPAVAIALQWSVVGIAFGFVTGFIAPAGPGKNENEVV